MFSLRSMSLASVVLATWLTDIVVVPTIAAVQSRLPQCPKIWLRGWTNCQGTFTFANGDKYVGEFKDGKYHGQGTATYVDGRKYIGEFKDGNKNGQGTYTAADGTKYVGDGRMARKMGKAHSRLPMAPNSTSGDGKTPGHEANTRSLNRRECWAGSCEQASAPPQRLTRFMEISRLI
jgi:hypothetical protein